MQFVLGEILRDTRHVLWGPCKNVSILTEEVDELAFLFTVQVRPNDSEPVRILQVQRYLLRLLGRLEGALRIIFLGVGGQGRLFAGHGQNSLQHLLLFRHYEGLGQPATGHGALDGLLVIAGYRDDPLRARHLHLQVGIVGHSHELGQSRSAKQGMVRAFQIHYLELDCFSPKVILVFEEDIHLDLADWGTGQAGYDAMENGPAWHELLRLEVQPLHGIAVQYVDTASAIN